MFTIFKRIAPMLAYTDFQIRDVSIYAIQFSDGSQNNYLHFGRQKHLIHYITSGQRQYRIDGKDIALPAGTVLFLPEGTRYLSKSLSCHQEACCGIGISFRTDPEITFPQGLYFRECSSSLSVCFSRILELNSQIPTCYASLRESLYHLLVLLADTPAPTDPILEPALIYIQNHFAENLPMSEYARQCALSESYFRKRFRETMDVSPLEYRNRLRLMEAKQLYLQGKSLSETASLVGFDDPGYLSKLYKKTYGVTLKEEKYI